MLRDQAAALELARRAPSDLIISDILIPVMDSFNLCQTARKDARLKHISCVFYSVICTDPKDEAFDLSLGGDRFSVRPTEPEQFLALLETLAVT
jgi:CheY-like chemotaxis protein